MKNQAVSQLLETIFANHILLALVAILSLNLAVVEAMAKRGGMETTGGGDGVACFASPNEAASATEQLRQQGYLAPSTRAQIKGVVTLETWDYLQEFGGTSSAKKIVYLSEYSAAKNFSVAPELLKLPTAEAIRQTVSKNLQHYVPLFVLRLKMVEEKVPLSSWIASDKVPQVNDSTPKRTIDAASGCVLIQLAYRKTLSTADKFPVTEIIYDRELFQKFLTPMDQALLMNHEYFYLIGREGNHLTSDDIRPFNTFLISENMFPFAQNAGSLGSRAVLFRQIIGFPFGDYMRFFKAEDVPEKDLRSLQNSRYRSFISMMEKTRESGPKCRQKMGYEEAQSIADKNQVLRACAKATIDNNPELWTSLTPEESFLFLTRFLFDQFMIKDPVPLNSEHLTYPQADTEFTKLISNLYCKLTHQREFPELAIVQEKTKQYCREVIGFSVVPGK